MLLALAAILLGLLAVVAALAIALRRQQASASPARRGQGADDVEESGGASAERGQGAMACPTCRGEYEAWLRFCPRDARALVPAAELSERTRSAGSICPRCRRSFEPGLRYCPYDAADLVPAALYEATRDDGADGAPSGVLGRICPRCRRRYDLVASFCGRDGCELAVIN